MPQHPPISFLSKEEEELGQFRGKQGGVRAVLKDRSKFPVWERGTYQEEHFAVRLDLVFLHVLYEATVGVPVDMRITHY